MRRLAIPLLVAGCGGGESSVCSGFVGDASLPVLLQMTFQDPEGNLVVLEEGARVPLVQPPQGGRVLFLGIRAQNLDTCGVAITAAVRDTPTNAIVGLEGRPVNLKAGGDGWAGPGDPKAIASYANVGVCPNQRSSRDLFDAPYELSVAVQDRGGRTAEIHHTATPYCGEPATEADCQRLCREGFGTPDAGAAADGGP